jgi:hypothetical protein
MPDNHENDRMSKDPEQVKPPSIYTGERRPGGSSPDVPLPVTITDVHIRFFSLMWLLVKLSFAAIPAVFIVALIWTVLVGFLGLIVRTFGPHVTSFNM